MAYQYNLGVVTESDVRALVSAPVWADVSEAALTRFKKEEGMSPPYAVALLTQNITSRSGPGTAYAEYYPYTSGTEVSIVGQYGNWLLTANGDYIPYAAAADAAAVKAAAEAQAKAEAEAQAQAEAAALDTRIRAAIAQATPIAITEIIGQYDFPPTGISAAVISDILTHVVNRIVKLATIALEGNPSS